MGRGLPKDDFTYKAYLKSVAFKKPVEISSTHVISTDFLKETDFIWGLKIGHHFC